MTADGPVPLEYINSSLFCRAPSPNTWRPQDVLTGFTPPKDRIPWARAPLVFRCDTAHALRSVQCTASAALQIAGGVQHYKRRRSVFYQL